MRIIHAYRDEIMKQTSETQHHSNVPPPSPESQPAEEEWREHEHISEQVQTDADRLLESAGDSEVAKHAVDVASARQEEGDASRNEFAMSLGFDNFEAAREGSQQFGPIEGPIWYVTPGPSQGFIAWNDRDLRVEFTSTSQSEALERLQRRRAEAKAAKHED